MVAVFVAAMLLVASLAVYFVYLRSEDSHFPFIRIDGNQDLTEENGVTSGDGTAADPYVIEDLDLSLSQGISIANTNAYLVIRGVSLDNTSGTIPAITITNVMNLVLANVIVYQAWDGIEMTASRNCDVRDCRVSYTSAGSGLTLRQCLNITAERNLLRSSGWGLFGAIEVVESRGCIASSNTISETSSGIHVVNSEDCEFNSNDVNTTAWGINLESSRNTTLRANLFTRLGVQLNGDSVEDYSTQIITDDNFLGGKPIVYRSNENGLMVSGVSLGELIIVNCVGILVSDVQVVDTSSGVFLYYPSDALVENVSVSGHEVDYLASFTYGIRVEQGSNVSLMSNRVSEMGGGIRCSATTATISDNNISAIVYCTSLNLEHAAISNNTFYGQAGVMMIYGRDILIANNTFFNCSAISVDLGTVSDVIVKGNSLAGGNIIARLSSVTNALFYHNEFTNCSKSVIFDGYSNCSWDLGYPEGGNYWSNYTGSDLFGESGQDVPGSDGIGDTPFAVSEALGIWDHYPMMNPISS
jgi:parallel beta-helix repeat protein